MYHYFWLRSWRWQRRRIHYRCRLLHHQPCDSRGSRGSSISRSNWTEATGAAHTSAIPQVNESSRIKKQKPEDGRDHAIIYPKNPFDVAEITRFLQNNQATDEEKPYWQTGQQIATTFLKTRNDDGSLRNPLTTDTFTAFFFVRNIEKCHIENLNMIQSVRNTY